MNKFDEIFNNKSAQKNSPIKVNVISFSGHGFTYDGDAIAVIPQKEKKEDNNEIITTRFINFSG
jgi:hypothetical protein